MKTYEIEIKEEGPAQRVIQNPVGKTIILLLIIAGVAISVIQIFNISIMGKTMWPRAYYALLIGCFLPVTFTLYPHRKGAKDIPWFDVVASILSFGVAVYIFIFAEAMEYEGWELAPPWGALIMGLILCIVVFEGCRRASGTPFAVICLFFFFYPLFASHMPDVIMGQSLPFWRMIGGYICGNMGPFGIPMQVVGDLLIGYLIFAVVLQKTGGGKFFINLAMALFGWARGGPAKVAVVSSALFGSISGSVVANVATTGSVTIPTMKSIGYPPRYAGAIEACASTGGVLMPPIMGATAFVMCSILAIPYSAVALAAAVPGVLYYFSLLMTVDAYAARTGLKGLPKEDLPSISKTLADGWPYLFAVAFLVWGLLWKMWVETTPYYASVIMIALTMLRKDTRMNFQGVVKMIYATGKTIAEITTILLGVGFIIGSLTITGTANAFAREVVLLTGGNIYLLLVMGAIVSLILGMGMTVTACYVFLAVTMATPLIEGGLNPLAVHLFVMYWGMISYITPPVALGAMTGAGIAGADPMETGFTAVRIGIAIYFLPFMFVLNPALILVGSVTLVIVSICYSLFGLLLVSQAAEGYFVGIGPIRNWTRVLLFIMGIAIIIPETISTVVGLIGGIIIIAVEALHARKTAAVV
jgi:TRAP transporter 4TM/12TM fusion protein